MTPPSPRRPLLGWLARIGVAVLGVAGGVVLAELWVRVGLVCLLFGVGLLLAWIRSERARGRRSLRWLARAAVALVLVVGVLGSEQGVNCGGKPVPSVQIVRGRGLRLLNGAPVWEDGTDRQHRACAEQHPERPRILLFGSSITYGSGLSADETFTVALERRLNAALPAPGVCVMSFAQPGYSFQQKIAVASVEIPRYRPALVLWEDWNEWFVEYHLIGNAAFALHDYALAPDGVPASAVTVHGPDFLICEKVQRSPQILSYARAGLPRGSRSTAAARMSNEIRRLQSIGSLGRERLPSANRFLFLRSHLYQHLTLSFAPRLPQRGEDELVTAFLNGPFTRVPELAAAAGSKLAFYLAPPLDRPFAELTTAPPRWHTAFADFARGRGIPAFLLQEQLAGEDYREVRLDPCCHYNARGHRALVPVFERIVRSLLGDPLGRAR